MLTALAPNDNLSLELLLLPIFAGRTVFKLSAATFSSRNKRQLLDAYGSPLLHMERKRLSLHGTWLLVRPSDGARIAELKPAMMSLTPCECILQPEVSGRFMFASSCMAGRCGDDVVPCKLTKHLSSLVYVTYYHVTHSQQLRLALQLPVAS
jgi:hypothetical protein